MKLFSPICVVAMATLGVAVPKFHFSQRHVILVLCAKFHDNRVTTAEVTGSRIFPQKNVVTMATMTPPTPKMIGVFALP